MPIVVCFLLSGCGDSESTTQRSAQTVIDPGIEAGMKADEIERDMRFTEEIEIEYWAE